MKNTNTATRGSFDAQIERGVLGVVAALSAALAIAGFTLAAGLEVFAPCRVVYRTAQSVQGSLACQSYAAIVWLSLLFLLAALVLGGIVMAQAFRRRRPKVDRGRRQSH
jgi:predicted DNA repair protein MutK